MVGRRVNQQCSQVFTGSHVLAHLQRFPRRTHRMLSNMIRARMRRTVRLYRIAYRIDERSNYVFGVFYWPFPETIDNAAKR